MIYIQDNFIAHHTNYEHLIQVIKNQFAHQKTIVPTRHHHEFPTPTEGEGNMMLIMPAYEMDRDAGVKLINVQVANQEKGLPRSHSIYVYMDAKTGAMKAIFDAKQLTNARTAATSALASQYLSRQDASTMLMVGTGELAKELIKAHCSVRPIRRVYVWGRNFQKAKAFEALDVNNVVNIIAVPTIDEVIEQADIISTATMSPIPLILGHRLHEGQHIDLVGAFRDDMRESDDDVMKKSMIYVDTMVDGLKNNGDIVQPMNSGSISSEDILGDLFFLCGNDKYARKNDQQITLFKSVGYAAEDLAAARYYFNKWNNEKNI